MNDNSEQATTSWIDDNIPHSNRFNDTYYTKSDGRAETNHVFIDGNGLPGRWTGMKHCTIGELGFGTGLNFIETFRQWNQIREPDATLEFVSFEQFPLAANEIRHALSRWSILDKLAEQFCGNWRINGAEFNMQFTENVKLRVVIGDANMTLHNSSLTADAWYLDGFSPPNNPQLWNEELMKIVFDLTAKGGTFATYSAAGSVRRNLQSAGFKVVRKKGFGTKREMLAGAKL